jgi:hypothetical protein
MVEFRIDPVNAGIYFHQDADQSGRKYYLIISPFPDKSVPRNGLRLSISLSVHPKALASRLMALSVRSAHALISAQRKLAISNIDTHWCEHFRASYCTDNGQWI